MSEEVCPHCGAPTGIEARIATLGLGKRTKRALLMLARHRGQFVETERILDHLYADDSDGGPEGGSKSLKVLLCKARPRLLEIGLTLEGKLGCNSAGYALRWTGG